MFYGAPFALAPPVPSANIQWLEHLKVRVMRAVHNPHLLLTGEKALHCAYFSLMAMDTVLGLKLYVWVAFPMAVLLILTFKGE